MMNLKISGNTFPTAAQTVIGYEKPPRYDEDRRITNDKNNAARMTTLQSVATLAVVER